MNKRTFLCILPIFFIFTATAQQENKKISLEAVLQTLQEQHEVTFTYADKNLEGIFLVPPSVDLDIRSTLQYLEESSGLRFKQLDEKFITISKPKVTDTVCGLLTDVNTGERISEATIRTLTEFSVSNENGYFNLNGISPNDTLYIRHLAYRPITVAVSQLKRHPCRKIFLDQNITTLQEVMVSKFITYGINKKMDGSFIINTENLGILPGLTEPDVLQTVQALPGIQSINETVSDINVRGGTNDQNLVLWNGIRMYQSGHFFGLISAFNPYLTKNVNLIKNGTSASLGEGVSSTIDIYTDDQVAEQFSGGAGINLINADIFAKVPLSEKTSLQLAGRRSMSDIVETPTYRQYFERTFSNTDVISRSNSSDQLLRSDQNFYFYDVSMKLISNISKNDKLRFCFLNINNRIKYRESALVDSTLQFKTSSMAQGSIASGLSYSRLWNNNKVKTSAFLYLSSYELAAVNFDIIKDQRVMQENKVLDIGLKLDGRLALTKSIDVFAGYQWSEVGSGNLEDVNKPAFRRRVKDVTHTHSVFAESSFLSSSENTHIRAGIRGNYFEKLNKVKIEPRISLHQKLTKHIGVELLGEFKSQITTQIIDFQKDFLGVEKRRWSLSNSDDLPLIESKQVSLGLHYDKRSFLISLDGYYKKVDGITSSSQGFQNQYQFIRSTGSYDALGFDFLVNKRFGKITTWASYSLAKNTFEFLEFEPSSFPNNLDIRHTSTYGISYQTRRLQLSLGANWHTGKPYTEPITDEDETVESESIVYSDPNTSRLDDYLRVDFSIRYNFRLKGKTRAQVGGSVWNVFNHTNVVNAYFQLSDGDIREINQNSLAFTPNLFLRITFN